jgi:WD40 repeat protein
MKKVLVQKAAHAVVLARRVLVATLIGLTVTAALNRNVTLITIIGLLSGLLALIGDIGASALRISRSKPAVPEDLASQLVEVLKDEWHREVRARSLLDTSIIPIAWAEVHGEATELFDLTRASAIEPDGRVTGSSLSTKKLLAKHYLDLPDRRLVVLGQPGAGKSALALLLALALSEMREPGEPVPILLPASTWDPVRRSFREWIVEWVARAHYGGREDVTQVLLDQGLVFPVVDGLDEIPEPQRRSAIASINDAVKAGSPVLITCRSIEYNDLIQAGSPTLSRAPVIEVLPVPAQDAITYLKRVDLADGHSWDGLATALRSPDHVPIRAALSTPLMISLCRLVISRLNMNPDVLAEGTRRFESRHSVEDYLTERVIDAAYAPRTGIPAFETIGRPSCSPETAKKRLTFIANYLHTYNERDFYWWRISDRLLSPWMGPGLGVGIGVITAVVVASWIAVFGNRDAPVMQLSQALTVSFAAGGVAAILATIVWDVGDNQEPSQLNLSFRDVGPRFRLGYRTGTIAVALPGLTLVIALLAIISVNGSWTLRNVQIFLECCAGVLSASAAVGIAFGGYYAFSAPPTGAIVASPSILAKWDRQASVFCGLIAAGLLALTVPPCLLLGAFFGTLLSKTASGWAGWPAPFELMTLAQASLHNVTVGAFRSATLALGGLVIVPAVGIFILIFITRAWPRFVVVRLKLAFRRQLPWRMLPFLDEARDLNVLRSAGVGYQFRHIRLQEHLAGAPAPAIDRRSASWHARRRVLAVVAAVAVIILCVALVPDDRSEEVVSLSHGFHAEGAAISSDGALLAVTNGHGDVQVWDTQGHAWIGRKTFSDGKGILAFIPGSHVLTGGDGEFGWVWDLEHKRIFHNVYAPSTSPDGRYVFAEMGKGPRNLRIAEARRTWSSDRILIVKGAQLLVWGGEDDVFLYVPRMKRVERWSLTESRRLKTYSVPKIDVDDTSAYLSNSRLFIESGDYYFWWDIDLGEQHVIEAGGFNLVRFFESELLAGGEAGKDMYTYSYSNQSLKEGVTDFKVINLESDTLLLDSPKTFGQNTSNVSVATSEDGRWLLAHAGTNSGSIDDPPTVYRVFDLRTGELIKESRAKDAAFQGEGSNLRLAVEGEGGRKRLEFYSVSTHGLRSIGSSYPASPDQFLAERIQNGVILMTSDSESLEVVDLKDLEIAGRLPNSGKGVGVTATSDGRTLIASSVRGMFSCYLDGRRGCVLLNDMPRLYVDDDGNWSSPQLLGDPWSFPDDAYMVNVLGENRLLVGDDDIHAVSAQPGTEKVQVWNLRTGEQINTLVGHRGGVRVAGIVPGSRRIVTIGADDTIRFWRL